MIKIKVYSKTEETKLMVEVESKKLDVISCLELIDEYLIPKQDEKIIIQIEKKN